MSDKMIKVNVCDIDIKEYEKEIITKRGLDFMLNASGISVPIGDSRNEIIVYSYENHIRVSAYSGGLDDIFMILNKYVWALLSARNNLLNTENISSEANMIFISEANTLKVVYSQCITRSEIEKVCHVARFFSGWSDVVGAKSSMEMLISRISNKNLSLKNCLKVIENVHREWNHIN